MLTVAGGIVGAYLAFYSERLIEGAREKFCNLAAFCVLEEYRANGLRLVRALLAQRRYHFTDLSPSGSVIKLNERLGFASLDTSTVALVNLPWLPDRDVRVTCDPKLIKSRLQGADQQIFEDHRRAAAAKHILISRGGEHCYIIARRDRRKKLPIFASLLYVGNSELLNQTLRQLCGHLLLRHRVLITLSESRVVGFRSPGIKLRRPRPKMFKSKTLAPSAIDYLYSELTCVAW
jgi:hypothetical protein